jgi:hypothetical protein
LVRDRLRKRLVRVAMSLEFQATSANSTDEATHIPVDPGQVIDDVLAHF